MSPAAKFNALLSSVTISVMFLMVSQVAPRLMELGSQHPIALSASALVLSAGIYRLLAVGVRWLMERSTWVSSKVLGANFMHGTWIGWFEGHAGQKRYMVEYFVQDLDGLVITGRSFHADRQEHGYWESEASTIDSRKGRLIFTYKFDVLTQKNSLIGIHTSLFERTSAHAAPTGLSGFAHDLNDPTRIAIHSQKLADHLVPWKQALDQAATRF